MSTGPDRRAHPRFDAALRVTFVDMDDLRQEMTTNLSRGGCGVVSKVSRETESRVPITLVHPKTGVELTLIGEVVRVERKKDGTWALGMRFVDDEGAVQQELATFVDSAVGIAGPSAPPVAEPLAPEPPAADPADVLHAASQLTPDTVLRMSNSGRLTGLRIDALRIVPWVNGRRTVAEIIKGYGKPAGEVTPELAYLLARGVISPGMRMGPGLDRATSAPAGAPSSRPAPVAATPRAASSKTPATKGGKAVAFVLTGLLVFNVWYWVILPRMPGPRALMPSDFPDVPMVKLQVQSGQAYGVVTPDWASLPNRPEKVEALATRLRQDVEAKSLVLSDASSKIVATVQDGKVTVY